MRPGATTSPPQSIILAPCGSARAADRRPEIPDAAVLDINSAARLAPARGIDKAGVEENQRQSGVRGGVGHGPLL